MSVARICFFLCPSVLGGVEVIASTLARHLDPTRYQPILVCLSPNATVPKNLPARVKTFPLRRRRDVLSLGKWLKTRRVDLAESFGYFTGGACAALSAGIPHLWGINTSFKISLSNLSYSERNRHLKQMSLLSPSLVVPSKALQEEFRTFPSFSTHLIPQGIEVGPIQKATPEMGRRFRKQWNLPSDGKVVAMVGNFFPAKNHANFLKAGALLCRWNPYVQPVIAGRPLESPFLLREVSERYRRSLLNLAARLGIRESLRIVHFNQTNRGAFLQAVDVVVAPGVEGMSLAMLEAMAAGRPVVSVNQGGSADCIKGGSSGILVPVGAPRKLARAVSEFLENEALARRMGTAAAHRIQRYFTAHHQAKRYEDLYDRILSRNRSIWSAA